MLKKKHKDIVPFRLGSKVFRHSSFEDFYGVIGSNLEKVNQNKLDLNIKLLCNTDTKPFNCNFNISTELATHILDYSKANGFINYVSRATLCYMPKSEWDKCYLKGLIK
jgi:hypothetical protein